MGYETPTSSNQSLPALPERRDSSTSEEVNPGSVLIVEQQQYQKASKKVIYFNGSGATRFHMFLDQNFVPISKIMFLHLSTCTF